MTLAIAVMSCATNKEKREAIRRTWMTDVPQGIDTLFFVGDVEAEDAIRLTCPDDYQNCHLKQFQMIRYCRDYESVFFCDDDTYVVVDRLIASRQNGYTGFPCEIENRVVMAHGGAGFWMSKKSMRLALTVSESHPIFSQTIYSDRLVGHLMHIVGVKLHPDYRFNPGKYAGDKGYCNLVPNKENKYITTHFAVPSLMDLLDYHFKHGGPLKRNIYDMHFGGTRVLFFENKGKWYYMIEGTSQSVGIFNLAHEAEVRADEQIKAMVAKRAIP